jgi:hypothetical protein
MYKSDTDGVSFSTICESATRSVNYNGQWISDTNSEGLKWIKVSDIGTKTLDFRQTLPSGVYKENTRVRITVNSNCN